MNRYDYIDALRGGAIVLVLFVHIGQAATPAVWPFTWLVAHGANGVQLFYIVSAFTLLLSWQSRKAKEEKPLRNFFLRRLFRIAPMFWLAMLVYLLVDGLAPRFWAPNGITPGNIVATALFANQLHPEWINSIVPGGWSVAVEMVFYLLLPVLAVTLVNLPWATLAFLCSLPLAYKLKDYGLAYAHQQTDSGSVADAYVKFWLPNQLPVFLLGAMVFRLYPTLTRWTATSWRYLQAALIAGAGIAVYMYQDRLYPRWLAPEVIFSLLLAPLVVAVILVPARLVVNRVTVYIGQVSYSLYLLHFLALRIAESLRFEIVYVTRWQPPLPLAFVLFFLTTAVIGVALATLSYRLIEQPGITLGRRLIERLEARARKSAEAGVTV